MSKQWPMKAEPMTTSQLDLWLQGRIPRRHLAIPFGGDLPSKASPLGVDKDGEWFDADSDLYGPFASLRQTRDRLVDWHHVTFVKGYRDPTNVMPGAILAKMVLDPEPSEEEVDGEKFYGVWADLWANLSEHRRLAIGALERRNVPLFGSSVPVAKAVQVAPNGHIDIWPVRFHTMTTSPINTRAVLPALAKADLLDDPSLADLPVGALRAFLTGEDDLGPDLLPTSARGEEGAKAGRVLSGVNEADIDEAVATLLGAAERLRSVLARQRKETPSGGN